MKNSKKNFHQESFMFCFHCLFPLQGQSIYFSFVFCQFLQNGEIKIKRLHTGEQSIRLKQSIIADRHVIYFNFIHADRENVLLLTLIDQRLL